MGERKEKDKENSSNQKAHRQPNILQVISGVSQAFTQKDWLLDPGSLSIQFHTELPTVLNDH